MQWTQSSRQGVHAQAVTGGWAMWGGDSGGAWLVSDFGVRDPSFTLSPQYEM